MKARQIMIIGYNFLDRYTKKDSMLTSVFPLTINVLQGKLSNYLGEVNRIAFLFIFLIISNSHAQNLPVNQNCETPTLVCQTLSETYVFEDTDMCTQALYYYLNYDFDFYSSSFDVETTTNPGLYLILYGPFNGSVLDACAQIETFNAPVAYGVTGSSLPPVNFPVEQGFYILKAIFSGCTYILEEHAVSLKISPVGDLSPLCETIELPCQDCITSFSPTPGKYLVSAWVKEEGASSATTTYLNSSIEVSYTGDASIETLVPSGQIIDGWQRVEGIIEVPAPATDIHLSFETSSGTSYYDDIRFHPLDGSMMSYVYDPVTLRLMAELDERNYATFYEYDEEGKLTRVKKETEKGIMTIQENRDNIIKQ